MKVLHVVTVPDSLVFLRGRASWMSARGVQTEIACSPGDDLDRFSSSEGVVSHPVHMTRAITPLADIRSILRLTRILRRTRPDVVHSHTPKGGLVGMAAARLAGVSVRIYQIHGFPYETATGLRRKIMIVAERAACCLSTEVLAVSASVLEVARRDRVCPTRKGIVLGAGSINGVDLDVFNRDLVRPRADSLRLSLGLPEGVPIVGFVGRLVADKGVATLERAWQRLRVTYPDARLLLVGKLEAGDPVAPEVIDRLRNDARVCFAGFLDEPASAYALMDVLAFPSRREGFGLAALEAGAMGVPVVATDVTGLRDAVVDGETGTLVPGGDADAFERGICRYLDDPELSRLHGTAARRRAASKFGPEQIWENTIGTYARLSARSQGRRWASGKA